MAEFTYLYDRGDPTLVLLHGTGGSEREMFELGPKLLPGAGRLAPLGKEPENGQNRWFRRLAEGVFDEPNLVFRANELADFLVDALPDSRRVAVGFSNGANIAAAILLLRPEVFDGAALLAPMTPLVPLALPSLEGRRILMVCGERDPIVPVENAQRLADMFESAGSDLTVRMHPGGHFLGGSDWKFVGDWLEQI